MMPGHGGRGSPVTALAGVRAVEVGDGVALGYCGALFAACGAEVVKIEPPETGCATRRLPPLAAGVAAPEASGLHAFLSAGKKSAALDLGAPADAARVRALAAGADVVLEALGPGRAAAFGLDRGALAAANPASVVVSLSWFGADGSRRGWAGSDAVVQALAGFLYPIGPEGGPPVVPGGWNAQITGALAAFVAAAAALIGVRAGGPGAWIDQSILEAQMAYTENAGVRAAYGGPPAVRQGLNRFQPTYPQTIWRAADGWIGVTALTPAQWRACCELAGAPELIDDPRFRTAHDRSACTAELDRLLAPRFRARPALEWFHEGQKRRVPFALVPEMADLGRLDHFRARGLLAEYSHPDLGRFPAACVPWKLSRTPLCRGGAAPRLGAHTDSVRPAAAPARRVPAAAAEGATGPLGGIRVLDFTMGWSGPLATRHLADMGAEVVKVESCRHPDWWRGWEHTPESVAAMEHERSAAFNQVNRNKLGVAIDLATPRGRDLALRLAARADAAIENHATGVMDRLGLSFDALRAANPDIVVLSLPAFGADGPWAGYRGYGSTVEHAAGLPHLTGEAGGPPVQTHVAYGDACGGLNAAAALLAGLYRSRGGDGGQRIDLSQVECMLQLGAHGPVAQGLAGAPPPRTGNRHPVFAPHGCFACAGADSWLAVAVTDDGQWPALCRIVGRPDLAADAALATAAGRRRREDEIEAAVAAWTATHDADAAMRRLQAAGLAAGAVRRPGDALHDEGLRERGFWIDLERAVVGVRPHPATPWRIDSRRAPLRRPAPLLGEHNDAVLGGLLGLPGAEIAALRDSGVIGDRPTTTARG